MLNAENILKLANEKNFEEIAAICKNELVSISTKEKGGSELEKRRKAFVKYVEHCVKSNQHREQIAGFFYTTIQGERMQTATDCYSAICIPESKAFEGAAHSILKDEEINLNVDHCFSKGWKSFDTIHISLKEFNTIHKVIKAEGKLCFVPQGKKNPIPVCKLGNNHFDMELVKRIFDILGDCTLYLNPKLAVCVARSEIGLGLILPINVTVKAIAGNFTDYLEKVKEEFNR